MFKFHKSKCTAKIRSKHLALTEIKSEYPLYNPENYLINFIFAEHSAFMVLNHYAFFYIAVTIESGVISYFTQKISSTGNKGCQHPVDKI